MFGAREAYLPALLRSCQPFLGLSLRSPALGLEIHREGAETQIPDFLCCYGQWPHHSPENSDNQNALSGSYPVEVPCSSVALSLLLTPENLRHCQNPGPNVLKPGTWGLSKQMKVPYLLRLCSSVTSQVALPIYRMTFLSAFLISQDGHLRSESVSTQH